MIDFSPHGKTLIDFEPYPKTPRLSGSVTVTEKIDGTNACVLIDSLSPGSEFGGALVRAASRKRLITPDDDNFGFATWVDQHAEELATELGPGRHYGEWWGRGIQRGYGINDRRFSVFSPGFYGLSTEWGLNSVPVLAYLPFLDMYDVDAILGQLVEHGSRAAPGWMKPEGVIVSHAPSRHRYKAFCAGEK